MTKHASSAADQHYRELAALSSQAATMDEPAVAGPLPGVAGPSDDGVYSAEEAALIAERLEALGYVE
jgi:hypothetical protein